MFKRGEGSQKPLCLDGRPIIMSMLRGKVKLVDLGRGFLALGKGASDCDVILCLHQHDTHC